MKYVITLSLMSFSALAETQIHCRSGLLDPKEVILNVSDRVDNIVAGTFEMNYQFTSSYVPDQVFTVHRKGDFHGTTSDEIFLDVTLQESERISSHLKIIAKSGALKGVLDGRIRLDCELEED